MKNFICCPDLVSDAFAITETIAETRLRVINSARYKIFWLKVFISERIGKT